MRRLLAPLGLLGVLLPAAAGHSTVLFDWDLSELTRRADLIVIAKVIGKRSFAAENTIMTSTRLRVERVISGSEASEIEVLQLGGQLGARIVDVPGDAELRDGEHYLLFTAQPSGQPYRSLVGMSLGALQVKGEELTQTVDVPLFGGGGELLPAPGVRIRSLSEVIRVIERSRR